VGDETPRAVPLPCSPTGAADLRTWLAPHTTLPDYPPPPFGLGAFGTGFLLFGAKQNRVLRSAATPIKASGRRRARRVKWNSGRAAKRFHLRRRDLRRQCEAVMSIVLSRIEHHQSNVDSGRGLESWRGRRHDWNAMTEARCGAVRAGRCGLLEDGIEHHSRTHAKAGGLAGCDERSGAECGEAHGEGRND
jgi:hypothetical protein